MSRVAALVVADLHLRHTCPPARSAEPDWYDAMARPLKELCELQLEYSCPVLVAGDVFDSWNSPPELINFAINQLPKAIMAIPGQHDLPYHDLGSVNKSAYGTVCLCRKIRSSFHLKPTVDFRAILFDGFTLSPYPYGIPVVEGKGAGKLNIAMIHSMVWTGKHGFEGASKEANVKAWLSRLKGYDVAVFGDNHSPFSYVEGMGCTIWNCGCFIRQKSDERAYQPRVGLIHDNGFVEPYYLDTSKDKWVENMVETATVESGKLKEFLAELNNSQHDSLDFRKAIEEYLVKGKISEGTRRMLEEAMEEANQWLIGRNTVR